MTDLEPPRDEDGSDAQLRTILATTKTIAVVGASDDPDRPSHGVLRYLVSRRYRVFAVNPKLAGGLIAGVPVYGCLADLPEPVDLVDVFRAGTALPALVEDVLAMRPRPAVIWTQLGVHHDEAVATARAAGIAVVVDRCPKIEIPRLFPR